MQPSLTYNPFDQLDAAVSEVFEMMLSRTCVPASPCALDASGLTALVRFSGGLTGFCALHLGLTSAGELTEQLTGEPPPPGSPLPADTVGELCNMIAGSWKSRLEPGLAACHLSSPTIQPAPASLPLPPTYTRTYQFAPHCLILELTLA